MDSHANCQTRSKCAAEKNCLGSVAVNALALFDLFTLNLVFTLSAFVDLSRPVLWVACKGVRGENPASCTGSHAVRGRFSTTTFGVSASFIEPADKPAQCAADQRLWRSQTSISAVRALCNRRRPVNPRNVSLQAGDWQPHYPKRRWVLPPV